MPFINPTDATFWSGVGAAHGWLWPINHPQPESIGVGAAGGWRNGQFIGTSPRGAQWSPSWGQLLGSGFAWPTSMGHDLYAANIIVAGGPYWGASGTQFDEHGIAISSDSIGDVPPGYADWKWWAIGNDGTRVMVLNGVYRVWFPGATAEQWIGVTGLTVSVGDGCIVTVRADGLLQLLLSDGSLVTPVQRPGMKYFATSVRAADGSMWLDYSSAELGKAICHHNSDASQGYILDDLTMLGPVGPCGVTLADGRTVLGWAAGPAQQGGDLRRWIGVLGVNIVPFIVAPEPPEPEPPQPEPPDPQPEPEPEPMPYPFPKDVADYKNKIARAGHAIFPNIPAGGDPNNGGPDEPDGFWQAANEMCDRIALKALPWQAYSCLMNRFMKPGSTPVIFTHAQQDQIATVTSAIDAECLQR